MKIRRIEPETTLGGRRGDAVICPTAPAQARGWATLRELIADTPPAVSVLVYGGQGDEVQAELGELGAQRLIAWLAENEEGRARAVRCAAPADVVIVADGCVAGEHWFERLRAAAYASSGIATASALDRAVVSPDGPSTPECPDASAAVAAASLRLRPRILRPAGPCYYVRRSALELAGPLEPGFAARCLSVGLAHVLADDVLVRGGNDVAVLPGAARVGVPSPLSRSIGIVRRALSPLRVIIDARELHGPMSGRHVAAIELVAALAGSDEMRLQVLLGADPAPHAKDAFAALPGITVLRDVARAKPADIVHRPFQVSTPSDLAVLAGLGERLLITHHDLISYHSPSYFVDREAWQGYRELTQAALAIADGVVFVSGRARDEALAEELVEPARASVVRNGVDHRVLPSPHPSKPPAFDRIDQPMLLCLGTDFHHKNRLFALELLRELRRRHGWGGVLVFAGPHVTFGSSAEAERRFLEGQPGLGEAVVALGPVSEPEKRWLLERAALAVYPTVQEGFGLVPFEAAAHGAPCLWAAGSSLSELLPDAQAGIEPWDAGVTAERALELMNDEHARELHVQAIRTAARRLRWEDAAAELAQIYRRTCDAPPSPAGVRERSQGYLRGGLSEDAIRLVGPRGALPAELERPLLALATHRRIAAPVFGALRAGYRLSQRSRRRL